MPFVRYALTTLLVASSILVAVWIWQHYEGEPWTRDGHVYADVVKVTADVDGLVTSVNVSDNQYVTKGDLLFVVDRPRYQDAVDNAGAAIDSAHAVLEQARRVARRDRALGDLVATEVTEEDDAKVQTAQAALRQAMAVRNTARINLERTAVRAPVDGYIVNLSLRPGNRLSAGTQALALIDASSYRVEAYLEETKLQGIHVGDTALVRLMGDRREFRGHVQSIAGGIADDQRTATGNQLASINPTFTWVRLAQRIPVRILIDHKPADVQLIMGRTATVTILRGGSR